MDGVYFFVTSFLAEKNIEELLVERYPYRIVIHPENNSNWEGG